MIGRAGLWAGAAVVSIALHLGLAAALALMISPQPVPPQQMPETRLDLAAYEVQTDRVEPAMPEVEAAAEGGAAPMAVGQGVVRMDRAAPVAPEAAPLSAEAAPATTLAAAPAASEAAAPATPPVERLADAAPAAARLTGALPETVPTTGVALPDAAPLEATSPPRAETIAATSLSPAAARPAAILQPAVASAAAPATQSLGAISARAELLPAVAAPPRADSPAISAPAEALRAATATAVAIAGSAPPADPLAIATPPMTDSPAVPTPSETLATVAAAALATPAQPAVPQADRATAALAWTGDTDEMVDEVALAAIQSFMQPSDIAALQPGRVRDALTTLLASVPCSRIQAAFIPETGELELRGHIPEDDLRAPVLDAVRAQMGGAIGVTDNLLILPRPQCGALAGISAVDLPQSTDQLTNPLLVGPDAHAVNHSFVEGERMTFDLTAPDYDAYIHIDYFDADGTVIHLKPNEFAPTKLYEAKSTMTFGVLEEDGSGIEIFIGPPFGQEIAVAFATSVPLHDGDRPIREPAGPYLDWLRDRVAEARAEHTDFKGEWVYFFITTRPMQP